MLPIACTGQVFKFSTVTKFPSPLPTGTIPCYSHCARRLRNEEMRRAATKVVEAGSEATENAADEANCRWTQQLEQTKSGLNKVVGHIVSKLEELSAQDIYDALTYATNSAFSEIGESHTTIEREMLKKQQVSFDLKLAHSRTAGDMKVANKTAELEGTFTKRLEEKLKEVAGEGGEAILKAQREVAELRQELNTLKMKSSGVQAHASPHGPRPRDQRSSASAKAATLLLLMMIMPLSMLTAAVCF